MTLEQRLWNALVAMQLLSNGKTQRFDGDRVSGSRGSSLFPAGEARCEFLDFQARFARARSYKSRLEIVEDAERTLEQWRKSRPSARPEPHTYWWRVEIANSDLPPKEILRVYSISRQSLWTYRRKYRTKREVA